MTLPRNTGDFRWRRHDFSYNKGSEGLRYYDSEMKEGEIGSRQNITTVDVICEGEIAGFPSAVDAGHTLGTDDYHRTALKDVFLNNVQVLKESASNTAPDDSDFNFGTNDTRPAFIPKVGKSDQKNIRGIAETERDRSVGVTVTDSQSQTISITDTNVEGVRVTIGFPRLSKVEDDGSISGTTVNYKIELKDQANSLIRQIVHEKSDSDVASKTITGATVTGKSTSPYFKDHIIVFPLNPDGTSSVTDSDFPLTVTVSRITADSTDALLINAFEFTSITELIFERPTFANTAVAALRFDAEIFRSIPRRMYRIRGRLIKIPHNATVRSDGSLSFSGDFNGSLKTDKEWCNDPAWVLYDLLSESRAGFGDFIAETEIDKFAFYDASVYNSELIDNGQGGTSPRFSCNIVIQKSTSAYTLLDRIASIMRASLFLEDGKITLTQDRPTTSTYFFSYSNVTEDGFVYTGASQRTKDTVINVKYFQNETRSFEYETVEDTAANQSKYGVVVKNIEAIGCSDQAQARRMGLWHLFTQNNETETVSFSTDASAGSLIRPSQIITIQDPVRSGLRRSGRIKAATTTEITVDSTKDLPTEAETGDQLSVILTDGSLETKTISTISGSVITVSSAFSSAPQVFSNWLLQRATTETEDFRVLSVSEENNLFTITAMFHNSSKYAFVEDGAAITPPVIKNLIELKPSPSDLTAEELIVVLGDRAVSKIILSWQPVSGVSQYSVKHKLNSGSFQTIIVQSPVFEIFDSELGTYEFEVFSYNALFEPSVEPSPLTFIAKGKTALPADVTGLLVEPVSDQLLRLRFNQSTDVDVLHGGNVVVRHSNLTNGNGTFTNSVDIIPRLPGSVSETLVPAIDGEYILKFRDDGGRLSSGEASVVVTNPDPLPKLVTFTDREDTDSPPFAGTKVDCFFSEDVNGLVLGSLETLDDVTDFDAIADFDFLGAVDITGGSYDFANILDLGSVHPLRLTRHFVTQGFYPNDLVDKRTANIDTWTDFDSATAFDVNAKLLVATTTTAPGNGSSYQDSDFTGKTFNTFANGTHIGRGFKFRCEMDSDDPAQSIEIDQLGYTAELDRRTEQKSNLSSGTSASGLAVTFDHAFFTGATGTAVAAGSQLPSIGITANDLAASETFIISSISGSGFTVKFIDGSSNAVNKTFSYTAVGFGRGS